RWGFSFSNRIHYLGIRKKKEPLSLTPTLLCNIMSHLPALSSYLCCLSSDNKNSLSQSHGIFHTHFLNTCFLVQRFGEICGGWHKESIILLNT
ncbi:hypothetical protein VIGAN_01106500, partial [Vigna angularis var. angularis]